MKRMIKLNEFKINSESLTTNGFIFFETKSMNIQNTK